MKTFTSSSGRDFAAGSAPWRSAAFIYPYRREVPMYSFFPPVGLEYVAAAATQVVPEVGLFDLRYEERLPASIGRCDALCASINWTYEFDEVCRVIAGFPAGRPIIIGGRTATDRAEDILARLPNVSAIVCGDGHETIKELASGRPFREIQGLAWRSNGGIERTPGRGHCAVAGLQYPDRSLRRRPYRVQLERRSFGVLFDVIMTSWGCPFKCKFCALRLDAYGRRRPWSGRSPESVVEELLQVKSKWVGVIDENFFVDVSRAEKICDLIIRERIRKVIGVQARISVSRYPSLLKKMWRAGFRILSVGIESAHDKSLEMLDKRTTVREIREAFDVFRKTRFMANGYFIVGNIGETREEILAILPFARSLGLDFMTLNILHMEENSGLAELVDAHSDYHVAEDGTICSEHSSRADLRAMRKMMDGKFYSPRHVLNTVRKAVGIGVIDGSDVLRMLPPAFAYGFAKLAGKIRKAHRRKRERIRRT
jgi:anaerobic magnesium-protoporphyrin IX monomethyl ester cyclase